MGNLAIRGHATRGKEVIEILEMLGGRNEYHINITEKNQNLLYTIRDDDNIIIGTYPTGSISKIFSIEEFLEKFPYKVGDKVQAWINGYCGIFNIQDIKWDSVANEIKYKIYEYYYSADNIQPYPYKEETMEEELMPKIDFSKYCKNKYLLDMGDYEIKVEDGKTYVVRKKSHYPTTYEECCEIMGIDVSRTIEHDDCPFYKDVTCYEYTLLSSLVHLRKLIICRDAYWKIAGEQMGLDKPWEPVWTESNPKYTIIVVENELVKPFALTQNYILAFPTEEMRDDFFKNFKELIEQCKELL